MLALRRRIPHSASRMSSHSQFGLLTERRFLPFFLSQSLGAFNDNVFKQGLVALVVFVGAIDVGMSSATFSLLAGRQIVTAEKIEISALFTDDEIPDGQPARDILRQILATGGLPALNWAPGKWLGKRGRLIAALARETPPSDLLLVDTSLRFAGWPEPALYRTARRQRRTLLAGSDPLPVPGEEKIAGSYYTTFSIPFLADPSRIVAPLKAAFQSGKLSVALNGQRGSPPEILQRLRRNSQAKAQS